MTDVVKDETASFEVTSSDLPVIEAVADTVVIPDEASAAKTDDTPAAKAEVSGDDGKTIESDTLAENNDEGADKGKKSNRFQKRIDDLVRDKTDASQRAERAEKRLADLEAARSKDKEQKPVEAAKEPIEGDFDTYDQYLTALDKFEESNADNGEAGEPKAQASVETETKADEGLTDAQRSAQAVLSERFAQDKDQYPDFEKIAFDPTVPVTGVMLEALADCDDPTKVLYHLGQNKDLAASIAEKSPSQQFREIAKLELTAAIKPPKPAQLTNTPDPISPVNGSDSQEKPVGELSFKEYEAKMNKAERSKPERW